MPTPTTAAEPRSRTAAFFTGLEEQDHQPLLSRVTGTIRFDARNGTRTGHWYLHIERGRLTVSRRNDPADAVVSTTAALLEGIVTGHINTTAAVLRGEVAVEGDLHLLLLFDRLTPGPPGAVGPQTPERRVP